VIANAKASAAAAGIDAAAAAPDSEVGWQPARGRACNSAHQRRDRAAAQKQPTAWQGVSAFVRRSVGTH
jgi:hypothetical protein